ncbi:hypothetical protein Tdes44962_MAKER09563 [Teratosphaeria destructans]|uniref:Uncharacterized protein n=1 Tax=Teratosphaeria destructans TaxID=418781 RepID=A0A9W7W2N7_9PEZI|nr:hypothetical protein Tdes44962_MAKER09563 [Teratosphaeria destructans]
MPGFRLQLPRLTIGGLDVTRAIVWIAGHLSPCVLLLSCIALVVWRPWQCEGEPRTRWIRSSTHQTLLTARLSASEPSSPSESIDPACLARHYNHSLAAAIQHGQFAFANSTALAQLASHIPERSLDWLGTPPIIGRDTESGTGSVFSLAQDREAVKFRSSFSSRLHDATVLLGMADLKYPYLLWSHVEEPEWRQGVEFQGASMDLLQSLREEASSSSLSLTQLGRPSRLSRMLQSLSHANDTCNRLIKFRVLPAQKVIHEFHEVLDQRDKDLQRDLRSIVRQHRMLRQDQTLSQIVTCLEPNMQSKLDQIIQDRAVSSLYRAIAHVLSGQLGAIDLQCKDNADFLAALEDYWVAQRDSQRDGVLTILLPPDLPAVFAASQFQTYYDEFVEPFGRRLTRAGTRGGDLAACDFAEEHWNGRECSCPGVPDVPATDRERTEKLSWWRALLTTDSDLERQLIWRPLWELRGVKWLYRTSGSVRDTATELGKCLVAHCHHLRSG